MSKLLKLRYKFTVFMLHFVLYIPRIIYHVWRVFILYYTVLEIQFRYVNYLLVARICKYFEQNKHVTAILAKIYEKNFSVGVK